MRKLFVVFVVLVAIAVLATVVGALLGRGGGGAHLGGPVVLVWRVDRPIGENVAGGLLPFASGDRASSIASLWRAFRAAREDAEVRGVAVYVEDASFGLAKAQELRDQLTAMRRAGKFVECYLETAGEGANGTLEYYLATACEHVRLAPGGDLNLLGLWLDAPFLRGSLDKLQVAPDFNAVGRYKSAAEMFTLPGHSPAAAEALGAVLDSEYAQIVAGIAGARGLAPERVRELVDGAPWSAREALAHRLVDALAYPDEFRDLLKQRAGGEPRFVSIGDYGGREPLAGREIAVLFASGEIRRGESGQSAFGGDGAVGSTDLARSLRRLAEDRDVAAVVLRIDSPGGSALASDLILREVDRLRARKPVVVSMGDLAASGGYYIAARASQIVAEPATLTGSIGVFSGKFVTSGLETNLLGITHDPLRRGRNAAIYSSREAFTPEQQQRVRALMENVYATFVGHVAAGRKLPRERVQAIAEGRVWTGADALRVGLVDALGGLDVALARARSLAGIAPRQAVRIGYYPAPRGVLDALLSERREDGDLSLESLAAQLAPGGVRVELPPAFRGLARPF